MIHIIKRCCKNHWKFLKLVRIEPKPGLFIFIWMHFQLIQYKRIEKINKVNLWLVRFSYFLRITLRQKTYSLYNTELAVISMQSFGHPRHVPIHLFALAYKRSVRVRSLHDCVHFDRASTKICLDIPGGHSNGKRGYQARPWTHKSTLITYFSGMKIDPKYAFLHAFFLIYLSCSFQNLSKNTPFFQIFAHFAPLNNVRAYSAWSWKTTLITWNFGRAWYPPWQSSGPPGHFDRASTKICLDITANWNLHTLNICISMHMQCE